VVEGPGYYWREKFGVDRQAKAQQVAEAINAGAKRAEREHQDTGQWLVVVEAPGQPVLPRGPVLQRPRRAAMGGPGARRPGRIARALRLRHEHCSRPASGAVRVVWLVLPVGLPHQVRESQRGARVSLPVGRARWVAAPAGARSRPMTRRRAWQMQPGRAYDGTACSMCEFANREVGMNLSEPLQASAQHIELLQDKRRHLADALVSAELQFLAALRREYDLGEMSWAQLRDAYSTLSAGRQRGLRARWMDAIGVSPEEVIVNAKREAAVGAGGVWRGHRPLRRGECYPPNGQCVVYVLFDADHHPISIRCTNRFSQRLADHRAQGKRWSSWAAQAVDSAEAHEILAQFVCRYKANLSRSTCSRSPGSSRPSWYAAEDPE
jgi:hypothetical protein